MQDFFRPHGQLIKFKFKFKFKFRNQNKHVGCRGDEIKELPPRFIEFPFLF